VHPITALQTEYSLWTRDVEREILPTCRELGIGFVAYAPLGRGFLSGRFKAADELDQADFRRHNPRFQGSNLIRNVALVAGVEELARAKGATAAQVALAWVLSRGEDVVAIPGTKHVRYVEENVKATAVRLTAAELRALDEGFPSGVAAGDRYAPDAMRTVES
jgi:aryl-alcohol dehydrogenase-like predicted oxidoreductase